MILNDFNSDDYIYFRLIKDFDSYKEGDILRFNITDLRKRAFSNKLSIYSNSFFEFTPKKESISMLFFLIKYMNLLL